MYMSSYICHCLALLLNVSHVFLFLINRTITIFLNKFQYEKKKCSDEEAQEKIIKNILVNYILQVCNRSIMLQENLCFFRFFRNGRRCKFCLVNCCFYLTYLSVRCRLFLLH